MKRLWYFYLYLILVWGSFRYFIRLPEVIEELWFKPILWLVPIFWWNLSLRKEKVLFFGKKWGESLLLGILFAGIYFVLLRYKDWSSVQFDSNLLGVALATAVTEEMTFSGFVAGYLAKRQSNRWLNLIIVGLMTAVIRLPILLFVYQAGLLEVVGVILVAMTSGVINAWIRLRSGNVTGSILARWSMNLATLG